MTGVTLPLISYGGSSMESTILMFAIIQGLYILREDEEDTVEFIPAEDTEHNRIEPKKRNRFYVQIGCLFSCVFIGLIGYLVYFDTSLMDGLNHHEHNTKNYVPEVPVIRGDIISSDGEILAGTNVDKTGNETRIYPWSNICSHVVGYSKNRKSGLEEMYDKELQTSHSYLSESEEADTKDFGNAEAQDYKLGDNLYLTLDFLLQHAAYTALGSYRGAIVVMEPKTGKVLAMVSKPDFDPNEIEEQWEYLITDEAKSPLLNRATQGLYPPGSTFKIVTALEYLREHPDDYQDYRYECYGSVTNEDVKIKCFEYETHGYEDLKASF